MWGSNTESNIYAGFEREGLALPSGLGLFALAARPSRGNLVVLPANRVSWAHRGGGAAWRDETGFFLGLEPYSRLPSRRRERRRLRLTPSSKSIIRTRPRPTLSLARLMIPVRSSVSSRTEQARTASSAMPTGNSARLSIIRARPRPAPPLAASTASVNSPVF